MMIRPSRKASRSYRDAAIALYNVERAANRKRSAGRRVQQSEADDEVRANIPAELLPLFERIKRQIVAGTRASRTEVFLAYVESHPTEVLSSTDDAIDALVPVMEARCALADDGLLPPDHPLYTPF